MEQFKVFLNEPEKPIERQLYNVIKQRGRRYDMTIGDFMIWLKYNPQVRGMGWDKIEELFEFYPQEYNGQNIVFSREAFGWR